MRGGGIPVFRDQVLKAGIRRETLADENKTAYFPLLDEIAAGAFAGKNSDKELYDEFLRIAGALGFLASPELRASFNMALSIHAAAPRIEAHYQYYENSLQPRMGKDYDPKCEAWVQWGGKQLCRLEGGELEDMDAGVETERRKLQFDRTGETAEDGPVAVMYADILAPGFAEHHELLRRYAKEGTVSYRLRYKPPVTREERPVILSGYGVSLVLKKTDYVVMDDREVEGGAGKDAVTEGGATAQQPLGTLEDEETDDIKPLQEKDLAGLGYKAASFVMKSESSFETLQKLVQDFPKHSAAIAAVDPDANVTTELQGNWEMVLGPGKNVVWINGLQLEDSQVNAYALLDHLRRERNHIDGFKSLGLNSVDAINLLTHSALTEAKEVQEVQRFDYRDEIEGGNVIVWLNDIEKDERYAEWNANPMSLLRRIYPGQLHPFKRNLHHLVLPVDFTSKEDLELIAKNLRVFVERKIAIRFGLVPLAKTDGATNHAKVFYYLFDTYGLEPAMDYLGKSLEHENFAKPNKKTFESIIKDAKALEGKTALAFDAVLLDKSLDGKISKAKEWSSRMGTNTPVPTIFINGVPILKEDDWTSPMSQKIQEDIVLVQRMVYAHKADDATDFSSLLLDGAAKRRNAHIILENEADIKLVNVPELVRDNKEIFEKLPKVDSDRPDSASETSIWVVGDFDEQDGYDILVGAAELQKEEAGVDLILINNPKATSQKPTMFTLLHQLQQVGFLTPETLQKLLDEINPTNGVSKVPSAEGFMESSVQDVQEKGWSYPDHIESERFWRQSQTILKGVGINPGQKAIIVNGRVGVFPGAIFEY